MNYTSRVISTSVFALLVSASSAFALITNTSLDTSAKMNASTGGGNSHNTATNVSINAGITASTTRADDIVSGTVHTSAQGQDSMRGKNTSQNINIQATTDTSAGSDLQVVLNPVQVNSDADLTAFVSSMQKADTHVSSVETSGSDVSLDYIQNIKLFGFIPVAVETTARVDAKGQATISYPWYAFLAVTDSDSVQTDIQSSVASTVHADAGATDSLSASAKARVLLAVRNVMKTHLQASASADSRNSASGN